MATLKPNFFPTNSMSLMLISKTYLDSLACALFLVLDTLKFTT